MSVTTTGTVNTNALGTNVLTYTAVDSYGNTNTFSRTVVVRDTTPPVIAWSFTNLVLTAITNAVLPDLTGTNYILASDSAGPVTITQSPTNNAVLPLGTNIIILTVTDSSGNQAFSTNTVVVLDDPPTPPTINSIKLNPDGSISLELTNTPGSSVHVWTSTNLLLPMVSWQLISSNVVGTNGVWEFLDTNNMQEPARFYRASAP